MSLTTDKNDPCLNEGRKEVGQNSCYLVLSEEERAKGFVRPVRRTYLHKGRYYGDGVEMLEEETTLENGKKYVALANIMMDGKKLGATYITQKELDQYNKTSGYIGGCGAATTMGQALAETYARDPSFYGATFCVGCNRHISVVEFVWDGTDEKVGS